MSLQSWGERPPCRAEGKYSIWMPHFVSAALRLNTDSMPRGGRASVKSKIGNGSSYVAGEQLNNIY